MSLFSDIFETIRRVRERCVRPHVLHLEQAYENSYLAVVQYRSTHPRQSWTRAEQLIYNQLLYELDIAKTDLAQAARLNNIDCPILYESRAD